MKNLKNKKGFTIVELVIVIAVIAILAAVLIPTFSNVIQKANDSADLQKFTNAYKAALADALSDDGKVTAGEEEKAGEYTFVFTNEKNASIYTKYTSAEAQDNVLATYELKEGKIVKK